MNITLWGLIRIKTPQSSQILSLTSLKNPVLLYQFYEVIQVVLLIILVILGFRILRAKTSKVQVANLLLIVYTTVMMIGYSLEQHTHSLEVMCVAIKVQYFAQSGVMLSILWLVDLFCDNKINKTLYQFSVGLWVILLIAIFNLEKGDFFYRTVGVEHFGKYSVIQVKAGYLYWVCYIFHFIILARAEFLCYRKLKRSFGIDRKCCYWILVGPLFPGVAMIVKWIGITNGYDLSVIGLGGFIMCMTLAIFKYDYLDYIRMDTELDALTGTSTRTYFEQSVKIYLKHHTPGTLIMIDLDNFKYVNDNYGHGMGDKVLSLFGETLREVLSEKHLLSRLGGDEFCIYVRDITEKEKMGDISKRIQTVFFEKQNKELLPCQVSCSIGIVMYYGTSDKTFEQLYENADKALYLAKNSGKEQWRFYK